MMKLFLFIALLFTQSFGVTCDGYGDFIEHNGHYYTVTKNRLKFSDAKVLAENSNGYLAIPDSAEENTFLKGLISGGEFAWIGIYDPNYSDNYCYGGICPITGNRFKTVKGANPTFTNWSTTQPDNLVYEYDVYNGTQMVLPLGEHWAAMAFTGTWQDDGNHASDNNNPIKHVALFEFDTMPECYEAPSTVSDQITGKKCNTKIFDSDMGVLSEGLAYDCQADQYGHEYCPAALAQCGENWDYENGYSVAVGATTTDYTVKTGSSYSYAATGSSSFGWDNCQGGNMNYYNAVNYCASKGMRLPTLSETTGGGGSIPSCPNDFSWTTTEAYGNMMVWGPGYGNTVDFFTEGWVTPRCVGNTITYTCPSGGTLSGSTCTVNTLACPTGYTATTGAETTKGECKKSVNYTYYNYLCSNDPTIYTTNYVSQNGGGDCLPTDPSSTADNTSTLSTACNSSTPPANNCKRQSFTCAASPDRPCSYVNNSWQCSPFPCFGGSDLETSDTPVGINDGDNDGWNSNGDCMGQLYIFPGKDNRCRSDDAFFGLNGGGCCDKEKVFAGLVACKPEETKLAKLQKNKQCHYVGNYCSKKLKLGFAKICIQHKETHCCYNGKLARIINEQGRTQLGKSWGSAESPNCKGFTPDEFQKLDFSEIDLSEFFEDLQTQMSSEIMGNTGTYIQNKVSNILNQ